MNAGAGPLFASVDRVFVGAEQSNAIGDDEFTSAWHLNDGVDGADLLVRRINTNGDHAGLGGDRSKPVTDRTELAAAYSKLGPVSPWPYTDCAGQAAACSSSEPISYDPSSL